MYDDEAYLIEKLGQHYPAWRDLFDDHHQAANAFGIRAPSRRNPLFDEDDDRGDMGDEA
jgi:hypothetical protein